MIAPERLLLVEVVDRREGCKAEADFGPIIYALFV